MTRILNDDPGHFFVTTQVFFANIFIKINSGFLQHNHIFFTKRFLAMKFFLSHYILKTPSSCKISKYYINYVKCLILCTKP